MRSVQSFLPAAFAASTVLFLLVPAVARAADTDRTIAQYKHTRWDRDDGVPASIAKIAQGADGFLWLAGAEGLFRFDGVSFEKVEPEGDPMLHGRAQFVVASPGGEVWTWFMESERFAVYRAGRLELLPPPPAVRGTVSKMLPTPDGALWVGLGNAGAPLLRFHRGQWTLVTMESVGLSGQNLEGLAAAPDGAVWASYALGAVYRLPPGGSRFEPVMSTRRLRGSVMPGPKGRIWYVTREGGIAMSDERGSVLPGLPAAATDLLPPDSTGFRGAFFDREGHLWLGTWPSGIERMRSPADGLAFAMPTGERADRYDNRHGLTADTVLDLIEDREGNVWVATAEGIDRFRRSKVVTEPTLAPRAPYGNLLVAGDGGRVYIGTRDTVQRIDPDRRPVPIATGLHDVEALCTGPDDLVWAVDARQVVGLRGERRVHTLPRPASEGSVYGCETDRHGALWLTAGKNGLYRLTDGRWESVPFGTPDPATFDPLLVTREPSGALVMMWTFQHIVRFDPPHPPETLVPSDSPLGAVGYLRAGPRGLLLASRKGIGWVKDRTPLYLGWDRVPELRGVQGFVQTAAGDTWARTSDGIVRMSTADLERAFTEPGFKPAITSLSQADGVGGGGGGRSSPVAGGDGRIWFNAWPGSVFVHPAHLSSNTLEPKVAITGLRAGGVDRRDPTSLVLGADASDVEIRYAAVSLSIPERVQVRYRLEGYDGDWVDPGIRRQAFYTNLPPGRYRFQVIAANEDGVWNRTGAALEFELPPTFLQSKLFKALCVLGALALLWLWIRMRTNQMAARIRSRMEERLGERERIARELHDTLLQSVYGLILYLQSLADRMPAAEPSRKMLEAALDRAHDVATEGRNRVQDLRATEYRGDLLASLRALAAQMGVSDAVSVSVACDGAPRPVEPAVEAEILRIAGEALVNVARHARADGARVTVEFAPRQLSVQVRDDGVGIASDILAAGRREGHFGLVGMRERAAQIGASLSIERPDGGGTVVTVTLPAALAYVHCSRGWPWPWLCKVLGRRAPEAGVSSS